jgi:hypothetical protein
VAGTTAHSRCEVDLGDVMVAVPGTEFRDQKAATMTEQPIPEPDDAPTGYPTSWRPSYIVERDNQVDPTAAEVWLASLDETEFESLTRRVRGYRGSN